MKKSWIDEERADCEFKYLRLGARFRKLVEQFSTSVGDSIPLVCQDWAKTKAAYRFLSNGRVSEAEILSGHFQSTRRRFVKTDGPILVLQDTTEFSYQRDKPELIGAIGTVPKHNDIYGMSPTT